MTIPLTAPEILDREFLEIRDRLLQLAACFDRLDRGEGSVADDPRLELFTRALSILQSDEFGRAERLQLLFSREYDENWRESLGLPTG